LHRTSDFVLKFNVKNKPIPDSQIKVTYNNKDVTKTFLKSTTVQKSADKSVQYAFNKLNLRPDKRHNINFYWRPNDFSVYSRISYLPPVCFLEDDFALVSTVPFRPAKSIINSINNTAKEQQLNPSLLAGLIAQESGFKPNKVSLAKAVGLTQITPIAEEEIKKIRPEWPSESLMDDLDFMTINQLVSHKVINQTQDWRLDPDHAIEGGALYLNYLVSYWKSEENRKLLSEYPNISLTSVVLASYNSGLIRVKNKIKANGDQWLESYDLKEAFKYVNSVSSYCYHFSATD
jgi:soluble lytic murein transglycosylase-like protein